MPAHFQRKKTLRDQPARGLAVLSARWAAGYLTTLFKKSHRSAQLPLLNALQGFGNRLSDSLVLVSQRFG